MKVLSVVLCIFLILSCSEDEVIEESFVDNSIYKSVIAHRGFWRRASNTDNCIQGLREAVSARIYGVEIDVSSSKDDSLIVAHGPNIGDYEISKNNYEKLRTVKLANGEVVPTLREYLQEVQSLSPDLMLFVELKNASSKQTIETIKSFDLPNPIIYISFYLYKLKELKKIDNSLTVLYLKGDKTPKELLDEGIDGIDYKTQILKDNPNWIDEAKALHMITGGWVANARVDIEWCVKRGLDYITTDNPLDVISYIRGSEINSLMDY